jgi:hypothetical protein
MELYPWERLDNKGGTAVIVPRLPRSTANAHRTWSYIRGLTEGGYISSDEALDWIWKKVKNNVDVTQTRIKRSTRPGWGEIKEDDRWVTIASEFGSQTSEFSPLAKKAKRHVTKKLIEYGFRPEEIYFDTMAEACGVITMSLMTKNIAGWMQRRAQQAAAQKAAV